MKLVALTVSPIRRLYDRANSLAQENASLTRQISMLREEHHHELLGLRGEIERLQETAAQSTIVSTGPGPTPTCALADPFEIPIFILNFNNRLYLSKQLEWLTAAGYRRIIIIDNNSTYQPLLTFYGSLESRIKVIRLAENFGKTALWDAGILDELGVEGPFVYTDSDIVPDDSCPTDLVRHLLSVLDAYPQIKKAGPALKLDDLPDCYKHKDKVLAWERQFWRRPAARGLFIADIDTTFALYRAKSPFVGGPSLRTGWPYIARHQPWYADSDNPSEEEQYYAATARDTNWTLDQLPEWLEASASAAQALETRLLHLGCGHERLPGWINVDVQSDVGADIAFDLDKCSTQSLPFDDSSIDGMFMCHVFEHIDNTLSLMEELHRVAKLGAKFVIRLPHGAADDAFEDPTHRRPYFPNSFVYFAQPAYSRADYGYRGDWHLERVRLVVDPGLLETEGQETVLERVRTERNIVREMIVELSAVKPVRPRSLELLKWAQPLAVGSMLDDETAF